jgi:hypothetical protein
MCSPNGYANRNIRYPSQPENIVKRSCPPDPCPLVGSRKHISTEREVTSSRTRGNAPSQQREDDNLPGYGHNIETSEEHHDDDITTKDEDNDDSVARDQDERCGEIDDLCGKKPSDNVYSSTASGDQSKTDDDNSDQDERKSSSIKTICKSPQGDARQQNNAGKPKSRPSVGTRSKTTLSNMQTKANEGTSSQNKSFVNYSTPSESSQEEETPNNQTCAEKTRRRSVSSKAQKGPPPSFDQAKKQLEAKGGRTQQFKNRIQSRVLSSSSGSESVTDDASTGTNNVQFDRQGNGENYLSTEKTLSNETRVNNAGNTNCYGGAQVLERFKKQSVFKRKQYGRAITKDDMKRLNKLKQELQDMKANTPHAGANDNFVNIYEKPKQPNPKVKFKKLLFALGFGFIMGAILTLICKPNLRQFLNTTELQEIYEELSVQAQTHCLPSILVMSACFGFFSLRNKLYGCARLLTKGFAKGLIIPKFLRAQKQTDNTSRRHISPNISSPQGKTGGRINAKFLTQPNVCTECKTMTPPRSSLLPEQGTQEHLVRSLALQIPASEGNTGQGFFGSVGNMISKINPLRICSKQRDIPQNLMAGQNSVNEQVRICNTCKRFSGPLSHREQNIQAKERFVRSVSVHFPMVKKPEKERQASPPKLPKKPPPLADTPQKSASTKALATEKSNRVQPNAASRQTSPSRKSIVSPASPAEDTSLRTKSKAAPKRSVLRRCFVKAKPIGSQTKNVKFDSPPETQSVKGRYKYLQVNTYK